MLAAAEPSDAVLERVCRLAVAVFGPGTAADVLREDGAGGWRRRDPAWSPRLDGPALAHLAQAGAIWIADTAREAAHPALARSCAAAGVGFWAAAPIRLAGGGGAVHGVLTIGGPDPMPYRPDLAARLQDLGVLAAGALDRARALQACEAATETLANFVRSAPLRLVFTDRRMRLLDASPSWLDRFGLVRASVIGRSLYELAPDHFNPRRALLERCVAGDTHSFARARLVERDGRVVWLQGCMAPWRQADGEVGGLIIVSYDVTEIIEALDRVARSEERLQVAVETAKLWVREYDLVDGGFAGVGERQGQDLGDEIEEALGDDLVAAIDPRDAPGLTAAWRARVRNAPFRGEFRVRGPGERETWIECRVHTVRTADGAPVRLVGAFQDITERKAQELELLRAKEEAESASRAKSAFLATISHEIRTPLNGLMGMVQAMSRDDLPPVQRERLEVIRSSSEGLLGILNELLDISKIESGRLTLEETEFDLAALTAEACAAFRAVAENKRLAFGFKVTPAARGAYRGDPMRVRQILQNLTSNALKFTEEGAVRVVVGRRGGELLITVRDTGIGMTRAQLGRLFRAYQQAEASTSRRFGGTGLGLAICHDLVEMMGGRISVTSAPGKGTRFAVHLPLPKVEAAPRPAEPQEPPEPAAADAAPERPLRVLAAEDNSVNQLVLRTLLAQIGVEPQIVGDGRAAVEAWARESWDLILMDVQMPRMDGPSAAAEIRAREAAEGRARTPIIALTANAMADQVRQYLEAGMDGHVAKPIAAAKLYAALREVLEGAAGPGVEAAA